MSDSFPPPAPQPAAAQPYSQRPPAQPYPYPSQPDLEAARRRAGDTRSPLGLIALLISATAAGIGLMFIVVSPFLYRGDDYELASAVTELIQLISLIGGVAGLVLGLVAVRRPGSRVMAAIAIGLAATVVLQRLVGLLNMFLFSLA